MPSNGPMYAIDTGDLKQFARGLRIVDRKLYLKLNKRLREAAQVVVDDAKARASWSTKIPPTIKATGGATRLYIVAGKEIPYAKLYEYGTKGRKNAVRHPAWPRPKGKYNQLAGGVPWQGVWAQVPTRPFLRPAIIANRHLLLDAAVSAVNEIMDQALAKGKKL